MPATPSESPSKADMPAMAGRRGRIADGAGLPRARLGYMPTRPHAIAGLLAALALAVLGLAVLGLAQGADWDWSRMVAHLLAAPLAQTLLAALGGALCAGLALWRRQESRPLPAGDDGSGPARNQPSAELLHMLYERSPLALSLCHQGGAFIRANPAFLQLLGYGIEELRALDYHALMPADFRHVERAARAELREHGSFAPYETELINRDGMRVPVRISGTLTASPGGRPLVWCIVEDITARKRMVAALRHSEAEARMLSAVACHTRNMVLICDREGRIEWVNQAFESVTGYARHEAQGKAPGALLQGPATDPATVALMRERVAARAGFAVEILNYAKGGRAYWAAVECAPVFDHAGLLERYVAIERDITANRAMHETLAHSEQRFRDLTELSSDFFWEQDAQFRFVQLTDIGEAVNSGPAPLGTCPWDNPLSLLDAAAWARHRALLQRHLPFSDFEHPVLGGDGQLRWRLISGKPLFGADGGFLGYRGVGHDITARKEAEEFIQESKRMYRRVVEGVRDIIFQADAQGHFVFLNRAWRDATGFGVEEAIGDSLYNYVHPEDLEAARRMVGAVAQMQGDYLESVGRIRCKNGDYRWFEARVQSYADADGDFTMVGTLHDVTRERAALAEQRAAEAALGAIQERYRRALDATNDGVWERDLRSGQAFYSTRFKELLGFADHEFSGDRHRLHMRVHDDDRAGFERMLADMLARRARSVIECRIRCRDDSYRWFRLRSTVTCDAGGEPILTSGTLTDIHDAKQAEQELKRHRDGLAGLVEERTASAEAARREAEAAREAAEAASRAKSEFLANMSHELRTPMHAILSFASFGVDKAGQAEREKLLHYFSNIQKSGNRLLLLLNDLLDLSKLEAGKMEMRLRTIDPSLVLEEALGEAEALAKSRDIRIELRPPAQALRAQLDASRLQQVIGNLLSNAIKFSPPGGRILLSLEAVQMPRAGRAPDQQRAALEIRVRDEGIGIPEAELEAVFDKFVQSSNTKNGAGGTGLGLAICREIVHAHGGVIEARNNPPPQRGSCFVLRLPADRLPVGESA